MVLKGLGSAVGIWAQRASLGLLLGAFLVAPALYILAEAFFPGGAFGLGLFRAMAGNPVLMRALLNSVLIASGATLLATVLALPFAALLGRYRLPGRSLLKAGVMIPLLLPPFAGAIALRQLLGRYGSLNILLQDLGWIRSPVDWLGQGMPGVILLEGLHLFPILYFSLVNHFAALNGDSEEAALCFGGKTFAYYRKILLPEIRPGLLAGMALVFVWSFTDLGTPLLMEYRSVIPYQAFSLITDLNRNPMGYALTTVMGGVGLGGYWISQALSRGQSRYQGKGTRPAAEKNPGRWAGPLASLALGSLLLLAFLPVAAIVLMAFAQGWFLSVGPEAYTTGYFTQLFHHRITRGSIQTSLFLSSLAVLVDMFLGWWLARMVLGSRGFWARLWETLAMAPLALPGIILAFGYVALFAGTRLDPAGNPLFLLVMAYAMRRVPFAFRSILTGYRTLPAQIDEAAQTLGQDFWGRVWNIHLPLLTPYFLASGLLVFAFSMLEVSDSLILAMREFYYPITKAMYFLTTRAGDGNNLAAALAVVGMGILAGAIGVATRLLGSRFGEMFKG
ncbi:MAG TPA: iron ABC transporter permease [Fibrobacteria bacterium]|nr:iron ABC transporter permease [Fibrobacteria bacterium]